MRSIDLFPSTDDDSNESEPSVEEVVIPDSFPSDFPLYPSGKVDSAFEGVQGNFLVSAKTADAPTKCTRGTSPSLRGTAGTSTRSWTARFRPVRSPTSRAAKETLWAA